MFLHWHFRSFSRKHGHISKGALERSLSTNLCKRVPRKYGYLQYDIDTLDPKKFAEKKQQRLHIGNLPYFIARVSLLKRSTPALAPPHLYYHPTRRPFPTYPPDTKAFLYYFMPQEKPRIAGELRLRVTSSDDPASFESGSDLLLTDGQPWFRPLFALLPKYSRSLYEKLREDRLIPDDLDGVFSTFPNINKSPRYRRSHLLYSLHDTFVVDFNIAKLSLSVITEQGVENLLAGYIFADCRNMWKDRRPYTGSALARFERSTLPEHEGTRTIVLRFLKMITPVKCVIPLYDGYIPCPKEGELYRRTTRRTLKPEAWSVNIDKKEKEKLERCFQLLWNASPPL